MSTPATRAELGSLRAKISYGFGSIAFGVKDFGFGTLLLFYYNQVIGLPAAEVSFAIAMVLICDAFIDPLVGQFSDNFRSKLGRRHPFMYAAALPVAVSYFFLWVPPAGWSHEAMFFYLFFVALIVRIFISVYEIPSSAMVPEMTENYDQRTSFISFRYLFGVGAAVAMGFTTYRFLLTPDATHAIGQLNPAGYPTFALASAIIMISSILISARGTQRYVPLFRPVPERRPTIGQMLGEMAASLRHSQFLILLGAALFGTLAIGLGAGLALYFNTYFWGLTTHQIGYFALTGLASAFIGPFVAAPLSKLLGKRNAALVFYFTCVVCIVAPVSLRLIGFFPPNGSTLLLVILFLERSLTQLLGVGCLILFGSMMADVVEDSAVQTGRRSEGLFFSSIGFINKLLSGAGTIMAGQVLLLAHFPDHADPKTIDPAVVRAMALYYLPGIVGFYGMGILVLSRYRIDRERHDENIRILNEPEAEIAVAVAAAPPAQ